MVRRSRDSEACVGGFRRISALTCQRTPFPRIEGGLRFDRMKGHSRHS